MTPEHFAHIRHLTGCNHDQFAKIYLFTVAKQKAYETGSRKITDDDETYLLKIESMFRNGNERTNNEQ